MGLVRLLGLRTYSTELRRDLELMEKNFNDLVNRTAPLFSNEPASRFDSTPNNSSIVASHAHTHANSGSLRPGTGSDPLAPYNYLWAGTHTWSPSANITPVTVKATGILTTQPLQKWQPLSNQPNVVTPVGDVGIGTDAPSAELSIRARGVGTTTISSLGPSLWINAETSLSGLADNAIVTTWPDISGNARHFVQDEAGGPKISTSVLTIGGVRAVYLDVLGGTGSGHFMHQSGGAYNITGPYTVAVVWRANSSGTNPCNLFGRKRTDPTIINEGMNYPATTGGSVVNVFYAGTALPVSTAPTIAGSSIHATIVRRNADNSHNCFHDGVDITAGSPTNSAALMIDGLFCVDRDSQVNTDNSLAEMIVFPSALSATNISAVFSYFAGLYGTAAGTGPGNTSLQNWQLSDGSVDSVVDPSLNFGLGVSTPESKLHVLSTNEQFRFGYDTSNHCRMNTDFAGVVTFNAIGSTPLFSFLDPSRVISTTVPQFQILYDSSNYLSVSTGAAGITTLDLTGTSPYFSFLDPVEARFTTGAQFYTSYDSTHFMAITTGPTGLTSFDITGNAGAYFSFKDQLEVVGTLLPQFLVTHSGNVYLGISTASNGAVTFDSASGAGQELIFADLVTANVGLRIGPTAGFYTRFNLGTQSANITYILPIAGTTNGLLVNDGAGVLEWYTFAALGVVSGSGAVDRIPRWTTPSTLGNSDFASSGVGAFVVGLDASPITADYTLYFQDPNPVFGGAGYLITGAGNPNSIPIFGPSGSDLTCGDGGNDSSPPHVFTYDYNAGTPIFHAYCGTVEFEQSAGLTMKIGDVPGVNTFDTVWSSVGGVTFALGTGEFTYLKALSVRTAAIQDGMRLLGRAGGTNTYRVTLTPTTLTANRTATFPDADGTVAYTSGLPVGANPATPGVTLATTNGVATTFMRSDAVLALDQGIVPTWTGIHIFSAQDVHNAGVSLGTSGVLTRAALAVAGGAALTFTATHAATNNSADIGYLFQPTNTMGANTSIFKIRNSAAADLFDIRRLGPTGGGSTRMRFGFDSSNYYELSVSSAGAVLGLTAGTASSFGFNSAGAISFVAGGTADMSFSAPSGQAFRYTTALSTVYADGMVISNAANTTGLTFGASASDIFNSYGPAFRTKAGASSTFIGRPIVAIKQDTTQTGNTAITETDLFSYTIPAATLNTNGESASFEYAGTFANSINTKQVKVKYGATTIFDSGALAITGAGNWTIEGRVIRTGAATQKCYVRMTTTGATLGAYNNYATAAETLSGTVILKVTGTATGASDIVGETSTVDWRGAGAG